LESTGKGDIMTGTWRDRARPIIQRVLKNTAGQPENVIRAALRDAYPFGPREYYPYQVWLDEIKIQRGLKKKKPRKPRNKKTVPVQENQPALF